MSDRQQWYKPSNELTIFGVPAMRHRITRELGVFGKRGEVWQCGAGTVSVIVRSSAGLANQILTRLGRPKISIDKGVSDVEVLIRSIPASEMAFLAKILVVPANRGKQLAYVS